MSLKHFREYVTRVRNQANLLLDKATENELEDQERKPSMVMANLLTLHAQAN